MVNILTQKSAHSNQSSHLFTNRALKAMMIPLLIEQLLQVVVGIADTMMVSYAGQAVVSGVSLDTMIYTIFIYIFTAVSTGGAVVVSQYLGSKDKKNTSLSSGQTMTLSILVSLVCMALMLLFGQNILHLLYGSTEPAVMEACSTYFWIVTLSFPANAIYNAGAALYRSMGKTRTTMYISIFMNLLNIVGNYIGIFILHAGAAGVAWPTTISWYAAAVCMIWLCIKKSEIQLHASTVFTLHPGMMQRIVRIAVPNSFENGLFQLSKVVLGSLVATFGTAQIAANGIGQTIWSFAALIQTAMSPVFITVVGQCMGAGDLDEAIYFIKKLLRWAFFMALGWNMFVLAMMPLVLPFYAIDAQTKNLIWIIVIIHNLFAGTVQPFCGPLSSGLRAAGDIKFTMYSSIFCTVILRVILSFVFGLWMHLGVIGIALAMVSDWSVKALLDWIRFISMKWTQYKVI